MTTHKERAELRAEHNDPINFTCGKCRKVVPFQLGYICENCDTEEEGEEVV